MRNAMLIYKHFIKILVRRGRGAQFYAGNHLKRNVTWSTQ